MRNDNFENYIPLAPEKNKVLSTQTFFNFHCPGILSSRESWVYDFSKSNLEKNVNQIIDFYNQQRIEFNELISLNQSIKVEDFIDTDPTKISWTVNLKSFLSKNKEVKYENNVIRNGFLRPFMKQNLYYNRELIERPGLFKEVLPNKNSENRIICVSGNGANKQNCIYIVNDLIDYNAIDA